MIDWYSVNTVAYAKGNHAARQNLGNPSGASERVPGAVRGRVASLFGSVARNEAGPDSDVDMLVEFEGEPGWNEYMGLLLRLEDLLGRRVDLATLDEIAPRVRPNVEKDLLDVA